MKMNLKLLSSASTTLALAISSYAFAQGSSAAAPQQVPGGSSASAPAGAPGWINIVLIVAIIFFMWMFVFRPQSKRAKEQRLFLSALTPGIDVITSGGIIGTIEEVRDNIVSLKIASGSTVRILKSAITGKFEKTITVENNPK